MIKTTVKSSKLVLCTYLSHFVLDDFFSCQPVRSSTLSLRVRVRVSFPTPWGWPVPLPTPSWTLPTVPTLPPNSVPPVTLSSTATAPATPYSSQICSNCGRKGHVAATCFASGGGMEGQRAEYKRDHGKVIAMLLVSLDESVELDDSRPEPMDLSKSSFTPPLSPDTLDDHIIVPTMANLSVSTTSAAQNDIIRRDLYSQCESPKLLPLALVAPTELV